MRFDNIKNPRKGNRFVHTLGRCVIAIEQLSRVQTMANDNWISKTHFKLWFQKTTYYFPRNL